MKVHNICNSCLKKSIPKLIFLLSVVLLMCGTAVCKIEPTGTKVGAVQFDVIMELNSSLRHTHVLIFARYWVAPDYYSVSVIWAEPHTGLNYAVYPATLTITSDKQSFSMGHDIYPVYNSIYPKPLGERGVFRFMFGDYPIPNIRFADQEDLEKRIYVTDLRGFGEDANQSSGHNFDVSVSGGDAKNKREVAKLNIRASGERIDSMRLFNTEQHYSIASLMNMKKKEIRPSF